MFVNEVFVINSCFIEVSLAVKGVENGRIMGFNIFFVVMIVSCTWSVIYCHGPPKDRDREDINMGRKMGTKWCSLAKSCNHDRVPICGLSHSGDVMGFRDLCDMFDYNCVRRRNYRQTPCPEDKSMLTASRRPLNNYYDD